MLELFVFILAIAAACLVMWAVRELSGFLFTAMADTAKPFEEQSKVVICLHKVNNVTHISLGQLKAVGALAVAAWVIWLAILIR